MTGAFVPALWVWEVANVLTLAARRGCIGGGAWYKAQDDD